MIGIRMEEPRTRGRLIWTRSRPLSWSSAGTEPTARWIRLVKLIKDYHPYHWHLTPKTSLQVAQKKRLHLNASLSQYLLKEWQGVYPTSILTGVLLKSKERFKFFPQGNNWWAFMTPWVRWRGWHWGWGEERQIYRMAGWDHPPMFSSWNSDHEGLNSLTLKVGRGRGRKRKASVSPPPDPQPLQHTDPDHKAVSQSTHQDR